jgi:phage shock protein E
MKAFAMIFLLAAMAFLFTACQSQPAVVPAATDTPVAALTDSPAATAVTVVPAATEAPAPALNDSPAATAAAAEYRKITPEEAKARIDSGDPVVILDVRTREEYTAGHIAEAVLLPNEFIGTEKPAVLTDTGAEILIYCRSGNRSHQAALKLLALGYTNVWDFGGLNTWTYGTVTD